MADSVPEKLRQEFKDDIAIIRGNRDLIGAVVTNRRIGFDPDYSSVTLPTYSYAPIAPILEALSNNTTVKELVVPSRPWEQKELRDFIRCLSSANKGIKTIILRANDFNPHFIEALTKILKSNLHLKTLEISIRPSTTISTEGFARFCDSMEYYHFEELIMMNTGIPSATLEVLFDSIKYNQSVKTIRLTGEALIEKPFELLCKAIVSNPTITDLTLNKVGFTPQSLNAFKDALWTDHLQKIVLSDVIIAGNDLEIIKEALKANSSITDLTLTKSQLDWKVFGEILSANMAIKRLDINGNTILLEQIQYLNLGSNVALKELIIINCKISDNGKTLFEALKLNKGLNRLEIGQEYVPELDLASFEQFLKTNTALKELKVRGSSLSFPDAIIIAMANGLKGNKSLRKLAFYKIRYQPQTLISFIETMKENTGITELDLCKINATYFENNTSGKKVEQLFEDLVAVNKTLRHIRGAENYPNILERLKENRETQDKIIRDTCTFINMIVMKPQSFILPIEVWLYVFKYVSYSFLPFDFEQFFVSLLK